MTNVVEVDFRVFTVRGESDEASYEEVSDDVDDKVEKVIDQLEAIKRTDFRLEEEFQEMEQVEDPTRTYG